MGRKSTKSKEKKMRKKEESAKMAVSQAIVDAANKLEDPMVTLAPFKKFERNGMSLTIECKRVTTLDKETINWAFDLTKANMEALYEVSEWGWKDREKREEMTEDSAWYLIARNPEGKAVGFTHFRFDMDYDDHVLYCYEIQISKDARRKGLGKFLMQILQLMAFKTQMRKIMVTVFNENKAATEFFVNVLKFEEDETNPVSHVLDEEYTYQILSKFIEPRKPLEKVPAPVQTLNTQMSSLAAS